MPFIQFYLPPNRSCYENDPPTLNSCQRFCVLKLQIKHASGTFLCILGDFKLPGTNWYTMTSQSLRDTSYLDCPTSLDLLQKIFCSTHIDGNTHVNVQFNNDPHV